MTFRLLTLSIILLVLTVIGCKQDNNTAFQEQRFNQINKDYLADVKRFNPDMINHFPKKVKDLPIKLLYNTDSTAVFNYAYLLQFNAEKKTMDSIVNYLKASNIKPINYSNQDKIINTSQLNNTSQLAKDFIIIPYFNNINIDYKETNVDYSTIFNTTTKNGLSNEFATYVLPTNMKSERNNSNQYSSKGIDLNYKKGVIIYWYIN